MKKIELFYGFLIGIAGAFIGTFLFLSLATDYDYLEGVMALRSQNELGKLIALGAVVNIAIFFFLLKNNKELMARGIVLSTILLTVITLFV